MRKTLKYLILLTFLAYSQLALAGRADNSAEDIYKIKNIKIEKVSDDVVAGKQQAIDAGKKTAFEELIKRFITYGYINNAPTVSFQQVDDAIKTVDLIEEMTVENKFEARMNYEFSPDKILKLLNLKSIGVLPENEKILLIPVVNEKGKILPWNPIWFDAWKSFKADNISIPLGDLDDMQKVTSEDLSMLKYTGFDALARRYKIPVIVMAEANYDVRKNILAVSLIRFENEPKKVAEYSYPGTFGIGSKELFITAANDISNRIKKDGIPHDGESLVNTLAEQEVDIEYYRDFQSETHGNQQALHVAVITRSLSDWSAVRRKLINCKLVNDVVVESFSAAQTDVILYHIGEIDELKRSLANSALDLKEVDGKYIIDRDI